ASNTSSPNGSRVASPATLGTFRAAPAASMPTEKSAATHHAPDLVSSTVDTAVPAAKSSTLCPGLMRSAARVARRQYRSCPSDSTVLGRSYRRATPSNIDAPSRGSLSSAARLTTQTLPGPDGSVLPVPSLDVFLADFDLLAAFLRRDDTGGRGEVFADTRE